MRLRKLYISLLMFALAMGTVSAFCTDSDGGKNYYTAGKVNGVYKDHCQSSTVLREWYCSYGCAKSVAYTCPNRCSNGACADALPVCGNGLKETNEACDLGANNGVKCTPLYGNHSNYCKWCTTFCNYWFIYGGECGDGVLDKPYEQCDDGNKLDGDGCSKTCQYECVENWGCSDYGECQYESDCLIQATKYRTCWDFNYCGTTHNKPLEGASCSCVIDWVEKCEIVNIGDESSEAGHNLQGWGAIEPVNSGGDWGTCNTGLRGYDGNCRAVSTTATGDEASLEMDFGCDYDNSKCECMGNRLEIMSLDGISLNDDYDVSVGSIDVPTYVVYSYDDTGARPDFCSVEEYWKEHLVFDLDFPMTYRYDHLGGTQTVTFKSTAPHWSGYDTYGQIGITQVKSCWYERVLTCS